MCCLKYENEAYGALKTGLPDNGERVRTPDGPGIVVDTNVLREQVKVRLFHGPASLPGGPINRRLIWEPTTVSFRF